MNKRVILSSVAVILALACVSQIALSQVSRTRVGMRPSQIRDMQRRQAQQQQNGPDYQAIRRAYEDEAAQAALGADAEQWKRIEAKMIRIRELHRTPSLTFTAYGSATGGSHNEYHFSQSGSIPARGRGGRVSGYGGGGISGGIGGATGGSGGSSQYRVGTRSGSTDSYGASSGGSSGGGWGFSFGGGLGPNGERPVMKEVEGMSLGWTWLRPSEKEDPNELTESQKTCEQLLDALVAEQPDPQLVQERVAQLRQLRTERQRQLQEVQDGLRAIVTPEQEARLILMGYLD